MCVDGVFQTLERTLTEQKMEIDDLKGSITTLTEKAAQDKESLKKATRAQKLRAERFEAAIEKCYAQLKEKVWSQSVSFNDTVCSTDIHTNLTEYCAVSLIVFFPCWIKGCSVGQSPFRKKLQETATSANGRWERQTSGSCRITEKVGQFFLTHTTNSGIQFKMRQTWQLTAFTDWCYMCISNKVKSQTWQWGCRRRRKSSVRLMELWWNKLKNSALKMETSTSVMKHWRYKLLKSLSMVIITVKKTLSA